MMLWIVTFTITESPEDGSLKPKLVVYMMENKIQEQCYILYFFIKKTANIVN